MFRKCARGAETPRFRRGSEPPRPRCSLRPCLADGKPALFHRWAGEDKVLFKVDVLVPRHEQDRLLLRFQQDEIIPPHCGTEKLRVTFALVEYPDGSVGRVKPELIQFLDRTEG